MEEKMEAYVLKMAALRVQTLPPDPLTASVILYKVLFFLIVATALFFLLHGLYKRLYKSGWLDNTSCVVLRKKSTGKQNTIKVSPDQG